MQIKDFPREIVNKVYETQGYAPPRNPSEYDSFIEEMDIGQLPAIDIIFEDNVIVPGHNHDLRESNISPILRTNLRRVGKVHIKKGPTAEIYKKIDVTAPALLIFMQEDGKYWFYRV